MGPRTSLEWSSPCHGEERGFESLRARNLEKARGHRRRARVQIPSAAQKNTPFRRGVFCF